MGQLESYLQLEAIVTFRGVAVEDFLVPSLVNATSRRLPKIRLLLLHFSEHTGPSIFSMVWLLNQAETMIDMLQSTSDFYFITKNPIPSTIIIGALYSIM